MKTRSPAAAGMADMWRQINFLEGRRRIKLFVRCQAWVHVSPTRRTNDCETLSGTGRKQLVEGAMPKTRSTVAASSETTSGPWPDKNRHAGQRICVGSRSLRRQCRSRGLLLQDCPGRQANSSPTRSGTTDRETLSATALKQVMEVAMS